MNLFLLSICFAPTQFFAQTTLEKKLTPREIAKQTLPSTVLLIMGNSTTKKIKSGSGFFVAEDVVATNFHVIKDTTEGYAKLYGQDKSYKILGTVGIDEKNDLTLLKISGIKGKPLKLNTDDSIAIGDEVFAVGNPEGLEGTFSQGIVSSIRKTDKFNFLQITASISEGSSGGAVLNDKAEVVGVAVGAIESGQSLNFAIPVSFLRTLVSNPKSLVALSRQPVISNTQPSSKNQQSKANVISKKPQVVKTTNLKFGDSDENLSGKVKSITSTAYLLESKFDKWEIGKMLWSETEQFNTDGYAVFSEYTIAEKFGSFPWKYTNSNKINIDIFKENLPVSAKRISNFDYTNGKIMREFYFKCSSCINYGLQAKIIVEYKNGLITTFDSNGKLIEKIIIQEDNEKVIKSGYDGDGRLLSKQIKEDNGNGIYETYTKDGKVEYRNIISKITIGETLEETWMLKNSVLELWSKTIRKETENEKIYTAIYYSEGKEDSRYINIENKKTKVEQVTSSGRKYKYEYEFDFAGNWIKRTNSKEVTKFGESYFEPQEVTIRKIIYY